MKNLSSVFVLTILTCVVANCSPDRPSPAPAQKINREQPKDDKAPAPQPSPQAEERAPESLREAYETKKLAVIVAFVMQNPDKAESRDDRGRSLYHWLAENDDVELAKDLMAANVKGTGLPDFKQDIPLHLARSWAMAELLWNEPAVIRSKYTKRISTEIAYKMKDRDGNLPIHKMVLTHSPDAASYASKQMCKLSTKIRDFLLTSWVNTKNNAAKTAYGLAQDIGDPALIAAVQICPYAHSY